MSRKIRSSIVMTCRSEVICSGIVQCSLTFSKRKIMERRLRNRTIYLGFLLCSVSAQVLRRIRIYE